MKGFSYEKVIIGNTLQALARAYYTGTTIIVKGRPEYHFFDKVGELEKEELWRRYALCLSMAGLMPFGDKVQNIRFDEDNPEQITIITKGNDSCLIKANEIEIVQYDKVLTKDGRTLCEVFDWFTSKSGSMHEHDEIEVAAEGNLKKLTFYEVGVQWGEKECVTTSIMTEEEKEEGNNSELMTKFQTTDIMKANGIRGVKNGKGRKGQQVYLLVKIEHVRRDIRPLLVVDEDTVLKEEREKCCGLVRGIEQMANNLGDPLDGSGIWEK